MGSTLMPQLTLARILKRELDKAMCWEDFWRSAFPVVMKRSRSQIAGGARAAGLTWKPQGDSAPSLKRSGQSVYVIDGDVMQLLKEYWRREA